MSVYEDEFPSPPPPPEPIDPVLRITAPNPLIGDLLEEELSDAGFFTQVFFIPGDPTTTADDLIELNDLHESDRAAVEPIVQAHLTTAEVAIDDLQTQTLNKDTILTDALAAMAANRADIQTNTEWLNANPGASLVLKSLAQQSSRQAKQLNGLIRLLLQRFDGTD